TSRAGRSPPRPRSSPPQSRPTMDRSPRRYPRLTGRRPAQPMRSSRGEFGEFIVLAGQLPDVPSLTFKVIQAYSDGSQVAWIDVPAPGSSVEPEHPAPTLQLAAPSSASSPSVTVSAAPAAAAKKDSQTGSVVLSAIAVALAAGAVALGAVAVTRTRKRRP